jgi:hypothetical protein
VSESADDEPASPRRGQRRQSFGWGLLVKVETTDAENVVVITTATDEDLRLLSANELARVLARDRLWVSRQITAGNLPPALIDHTGQLWFSRATLSAAQRRAGELHAEQQFARVGSTNGKKIDALEKSLEALGATGHAQRA